MLLIHCKAFYFKVTMKCWQTVLAYFPIQIYFPQTLLFVFLPSARRHRQGNTDEHQRPMGGRGERTKGSLPIHPCENHRPPESGRERLTLVSAWTLSPVIVPVPEPAGRLHLVPASVATVTCLPAWGCTMMATPPLLPTVARLSDCLQLWTLGPNLKKTKPDPTPPISLPLDLVPGWPVWFCISVLFISRSLGIRASVCAYVLSVCHNRYLPHYITTCLFIRFFSEYMFEVLGKSVFCRCSYEVGNSNIPTDLGEHWGDEELTSRSNVISPNNQVTVVP